MNRLQEGSQVMATLLRREFAEHRLLFLYLPLASMLVYVVWMIAGMANYDPPDVSGGLRPDGTPFVPPERAAQSAAGFRLAFIINANFMFVASLMTVFWVCMAYYFLYTLYQQRRDRSVLFWNSLPVSDTQTVISKLLAGLVGCHAIYVLVTLASFLLTPAIVWTYSTVLGTDAWDLYMQRGWKEAQGFWGDTLLPGYLLSLPLITLWALPIYAWLLLASAWSRRAPFAWAVGPWLLIVILEVAVRDKSWLLDKMLRHLFPTSYFTLSPEMGPVELVIGTLLGAAFTYGAIRLNRPDDT
jgi:ABC-2 type transport system permease protein